MPRLFIIDTETGGVDPSKFSILTFAGAVWENGNILGTIELSIRESRLTVEPEAMSINKIDLKKHKEQSISPKEATFSIDRFLDLYFPIEPITIAGHNVGFDIGFLKRLYRLAHQTYPEKFSRRHIDTASILGFLNICGLISLPKPSLENAIAAFEIPTSSESRHTALGDVLVTCELMNKMKELVLDGRIT